MYALLGSLADYIGISCPTHLRETEFHSVYLYNSELSCPETALCICRKEDLPVNASLVLCCDTVEGLLCSDGTKSPSELFSICCDYLMYHTRIEANKSRLCSALLSGRGIQYLISEASAVFNNPIILADNSFAIIASSGAENFSDPFLQEIVQNGYYPERYIKKIFRHNTVISTSVEIVPPITSDGYSPKRYMNVDLMIKGKYVGFATIVEENPFKESDILMFAYLCRVIVTELKNTNPAIYGSMDDGSYFLMELLEGTLRGSRLQARLSQAGIDFSQPRKLLVFRQRADDISTPHFEYFIAQFQQQFANCPCVIYADSIVCLVAENLVLEEQFKDHMMKLLDFSKYVCGISDEIASPKDFNAHFTKAIAAISFGESKNASGPIYDYKDYYLFHMLSLINGRTDLTGFCSAKYLSILDYDKENGTAYAETLATYLACNQNSMMTAKAMHVHRNTVIYRIKRIEEEMCIDFHDAEELFSIQLSVKILQYLQNANE